MENKVYLTPLEAGGEWMSKWPFAISHHVVPGGRNVEVIYEDTEEARTYWRKYKDHGK